MSINSPVGVALLSVATAVPEQVLLQDEAADLARRLFGRSMSDFELLAPVFRNAGIAKRHIARSPQWYEQDHGWAVRNRVYLETSQALYVEAADRALDRAGLRASDVDCLVTVSTTGIATPSLEARSAARMGFRNDARRVPVFGLGCAGGVSGLDLAARLARSQNGSLVLFVAVELCSISIRLDKPTKANLVATALFGDGAAACILQSGGKGIANIGLGAQLLWPDTLGIMGWNVDDPGLGVIFDRAIPDFIEEHLAAGTAQIAAASGFSRNDNHCFTCHPGGAKVIAALEHCLALPDGALDHERAILRDYGNMSAPTVLFVLERVLAARDRNSFLLLALGPGFTASGLALSREPVQNL